ncbi:11330_t:CDS:2, partial [Acaulospora colombiana]
EKIRENETIPRRKKEREKKIAFDSALESTNKSAKNKRSKGSGEESETWSRGNGAIDDVSDNREWDGSNHGVDDRVVRLKKRS